MINSTLLKFGLMLLNTARALLRASGVVFKIVERRAGYKT